MSNQNLKVTKKELSPAKLTINTIDFLKELVEATGINDDQAMYYGFKFNSESDDNSEAYKFRKLICKNISECMYQKEFNYSENEREDLHKRATLIWEKFQTYLREKRKKFTINSTEYNRYFGMELEHSIELCRMKLKNFKN